MYMSCYCASLCRRRVVVVVALWSWLRHGRGCIVVVAASSSRRRRRIVVVVASWSLLRRGRCRVVVVVASWSLSRRDRCRVVVVVVVVVALHHVVVTSRRRYCRIWLSPSVQLLVIDTVHGTHLSCGFFVVAASYRVKTCYRQFPTQKENRDAVPDSNQSDKD
jgi:hypothetical protein